MVAWFDVGAAADWEKQKLGRKPNTASSTTANRGNLFICSPRYALSMLQLNTKILRSPIFLFSCLFQECTMGETGTVVEPIIICWITGACGAPRRRTPS